MCTLQRIYIFNSNSISRFNFATTTPSFREYNRNREKKKEKEDELLLRATFNLAIADLRTLVRADPAVECAVAELEVEYTLTTAVTARETRRTFPPLYSNTPAYAFLRAHSFFKKHRVDHCI